MRVNTECSSCKGTGLYAGFGEGPGDAVVCSSCKGTGNQVLTYKPFKGKKDPPPGIRRVLAYNPGICSGQGVTSGGVSLLVWQSNPGSVHEPGNEMRSHTCPLWWYQGDIKKRPEWEKCSEVCAGMSFPNCSHFPDKSQCWDRWDKEIVVLLSLLENPS